MCTSDVKKTNIDTTTHKVSDTNKAPKRLNTTKQQNPLLYAAAVQHKDKIATVDSGTTDHFLQIQSVCVDKRRTNEGIEVQVPDGSVITSTHTGAIYSRLSLMHYYQ